MWELSKKLSLGRYHQRRISLMVTAFIVALFGMTFALSTPALAADATRNGDSLSYDNKNFTLVTDTSKLPKGLPGGTNGYIAPDQSNNKTAFILVSGDANTATGGQYVIYDSTPQGNYSNPSPPVAVSIASSSSSNNTTSCDSSITGSVGWIMCPVVNFIANGMDHLYEILSGFLSVRPIQTDTSSSLYRMWAIVRDIANICFVLAFLVIVYSQITSLGLSNYNLKRMLPRLIIAAILVNISYWVSALAVDLSNFLGFAIHDLFTGVFSQLNSGAQYKDAKWGDISSFVLSGGTIGALAAYGGYSIAATGLSGSLILLIPVLMGVLIAALVAILVMAARQAIIVCLVIVSPLAFVAYLLPNTEKYFDKWKDLFMTMLLLFPIFSVIFGASQLAGLAIIQNADSLNMIILGMAVQIAPVVITPMLVKFSGALVGRIAGMVNNPKKGIMDKTRNWAQGRSQEQKAKVLAGRGRNTAMNRATRAIDRRRRNREGWKKAYEARADNLFAATRYGQALEAATRENTAHKQEVDNAFGRTAVGRQLEYRSRQANVDKQRVDNEFEGSDLGRQAEHTKRIVDSDKKLVEHQHEAAWHEAVRTDSALLRQDLDIKAAEVGAGLSKAQLDQVHAEVAAQGDQAEYILNLRGVDAQSQAGMLDVAHNIKRDTFESALSASAKGMAERKQAQNKATALKEASDVGEALRRKASGILRDAGGSESVRAQARREASKFLVDDIQNIEATTDNKNATNVDWLLTQLKEVNGKISLSERVAYSNLLAKAGGPGVGNLKKAIAHYDSKLGSDIQVSEDLQDYKDFMKGNSSFMGAGKDLEFWATNNGYTDSSGKKVLRSFDEITKNAGTWDNISAENLTTLNVASQYRALDVLYHSNRTKYNEMVDLLYSNNGLLLTKLKQNVLDKVKDVKEKGGTWDDIPGGLFDG